jgi:nucleoside-diphosphate-sugar epimerase
MASLIIKMTLLMQIIAQCYSFGDFKMPTFPWQQNSPISSAGVASNKALQPGDTIAVVGASGNVGKLVALRLSDTYKVNGIVRDVASIEPFFEDRIKSGSVKLFEANLLDEMIDPGNQGLDCPAALLAPLRNANAVIICTGTTAFPTKAWTKSGEEEVSKNVINALLRNSFNIKNSIASLDEQGLNTPNNVDAKANEFIAKVWNAACKVAQKRIIMLSSIGVQRREQMPFPVLNTCGVLDAKAAGEKAIKDSAKERGYSYTIVRPGQLFGGPYDNNYYLGTLFQLDKDVDTQGVVVGEGDVLLGDTLRSTLAEVTAQICEGDYARDIDFAVVNEKGDSPTIELLQERLESL